jgi:hypothetical protein
MLRIVEDKAEAAMAALAMARAVLKAGKATEAEAALKTAEDLFKTGLEPSRAPRGKARGDSPRPPKARGRRPPAPVAHTPGH